MLDGADRSRIPPPDDLPENLAAGSTDLEFIRPQLAIRSGAAWNARAALDTPPTLLIADYFGDGPPDAALTAVTARPADFSTPASPYSAADSKQSHGYLVAGLAAGAFEPAGAAADSLGDIVAGTWAGPRLPLRVVDIRRGWPARRSRTGWCTRSRARPQVVLNTSLGSPCVNNPGGCAAAEAAAGALVDRAGARGGARGRLPSCDFGREHAQRGSELDRDRAPQRLQRGCTAPLPGGVADLTNVLVVENAIASPLETSSPPRAICRNASSKRGGHVSAVGSDVTSLKSADTGATDADGGTSSAAPQVAGVAASMWAIAPGLTPQQAAARLRATARSGAPGSGDARCNAAGVPAPVVDGAYGAVLSAGSGAMAAVLDTDDAGGFDEGDLAAFAETFDDAAGAVDHGPFDLNGDGRTGGGTTDRVDLDPGATPQWGLVERSVAGLPIASRTRTRSPTSTSSATPRTARSTWAPRPSATSSRTSAACRRSRSRPSCPRRRRAIRRSRSTCGHRAPTAPSTRPACRSSSSWSPATASPRASAPPTRTATSPRRPGSGPTAAELKIIVTAKLGDRVLDQKTVTATPPPSATVTRTSNSGSATSFAFAGGSGTGKSSVAPAGVTSFTDSVSIDRPLENGGTASGAGTLSFSESYAGAQLLGASVDITGVGSAGGEASQGEGGGAYTLRFTVGAGGIPYSVTGSVSASGTDALSCMVARGHVYLFRQTQPGSGFVFDTCAPGDPSAVSESGSLPPGGYEFYVDAIAHADGGSSNAAADITL